MAYVDMCSGRGIHGYSKQQQDMACVDMCSGRGIHGYSQQQQDMACADCVVDEVYMVTVNSKRHGMCGYV